MKYKCLVLDHDDTVVNSTATIHHPCFSEYLRLTRPGTEISLEEYFWYNFDPGFLGMAKTIYHMDDAEIEREGLFWREYVQHHVPEAYPGIREIIERHKSEGGIVAVVSHSYEDNILRDYELNGLTAPDAVYGWSRPEPERKPHPFPLLDIMHRFGLQPGELIMVDDLKLGYDMANACGVDFAAAGWSNEIPQIEQFMRANSRNYFKTIAGLAEFLK